MFKQRRDVEETFGILFGPPAKTLLCLTTDAIEKNFRLATKEWGSYIVSVDSEQQNKPAISSEVEDDFNISAWLEGDSEEYDDDGKGGQFKHQRHRDIERKAFFPFYPPEDSKVLLYTCAACGNVQARLSRCSMCTTKYCDASWYVGGLLVSNDLVCIHR